MHARDVEEGYNSECACHIYVEYGLVGIREVHGWGVHGQGCDPGWDGGLKEDKKILTDGVGNSVERRGGKLRRKMVRAIVVRGT